SRPGQRLPAGHGPRRRPGRGVGRGRRRGGGRRWGGRARLGRGRRRPPPRPPPPAPVPGVALDEASVAAAGEAAADAGVAERVSFVVGDATRLASEAPFDLVTIFEALHDMGTRWGAGGGQ